MNIIKSRFISKFIHILLSLPSPKEHLFVKIEILFEKFLWNGKPPNLKQNISKRTISEGELQYPNIRLIDATMKISWSKQIYTMYKMDLIYMYGDIYREILIKNVKIILSGKMPSIH